MELLTSLAQGGYVLALSLAAFGSAMGTGVTGIAAIGAWRKAFLRSKTAPFILVAFASAPLSQTIYGMILMNAMLKAPDSLAPAALLFTGFFGGLAMGASAWFQGKAGAMACEALVDTDKGIGNYIMILGVIETVALFVMVFLMTNLK